jgi:type IX secretion system PorP/SprF family membrane protein
MKYVYFFVLLALASTTSHSQQLMASSFFDMHGVLHNPATAGSKKMGTVGGTFRTQWDGMPGGPQTGLIFGNTFLSKAKLGIGGLLYNDVTGPTRRTGLQTSIAYHIAMNDNKSSLSFGLEGRFQQFSFDREKLLPVLGNDPVIAGAENRIKGDAGFGVAFTTSDFQVGASVSQLIQSKLELYEGQGNPNEEARLYRHFYVHSNYNWDVDDATRIIPNLLFIYLPNAPLEVQGGARVEHHNTFWYGLNYRARQAWMVNAGVRIKNKFNIGYSFDIYTTPLSLYDKGSNGHEIMLRYDFIR